MDINIKRVLTDISTSLIPRLRSDLRPYDLDVDWQRNSGIVTINVNENGKKLYMSKADVNKNAKNFTFAIIDIASDSCEFNYRELDKNPKYKGVERIIKDFVLDMKLIKYMPEFEMALNKLYLVPLINEDYLIIVRNVLDRSATVMVIDLRKGTSDLKKSYDKLSLNDELVVKNAVKNFMNEMDLVYDREK